MVDISRVPSKSTSFSGSVSTVQPGFIGQIYHSTDNNNLYIANSLSVGDLVEYTGGSSGSSANLADANSDGLLSKEDFSKLQNIEANADVTDSTNVLASLDSATFTTATPLVTDHILLRDSDDNDKVKQTLISDLNQVLSNDISVLDDGTLLTSKVQKINFVNATVTEPLDDEITVTIPSGGSGSTPLATGTNDGLLSSVDFTKLESIEDNADVTDSTNVLSSLNSATISPVSITTTDTLLIRDSSDNDAIKTTTVANLSGLVQNKISFEDNGTELSTDIQKLNFTNFTITEPNPDEFTITAPTSTGGGGSAIRVEDNGTELTSGVTKLNFVNATITEPTPDELTITIPTGGSGTTSLASDTEDGLLSKEDFTKLGTIETNADVTDIVNVSTALESGSISSAPVADSDTFFFRDASDSNSLKIISRGNLLNSLNIEVEDNGTSLSTEVKKLNFTNFTITEPTADELAITAPTGGSPVTLEDNGTVISSGITKLNFVGATITEPTADQVTVEFSGGGGDALTQIKDASLNSVPFNTLDDILIRDNSDTNTVKSIDGAGLMSFVDTEISLSASKILEPLQNETFNSSIPALEDTFIFRDNSISNEWKAATGNNLKSFINREVEISLSAIYNAIEGDTSTTTVNIADTDHILFRDASAGREVKYTSGTRLLSYIESNFTYDETEVLKIIKDATLSSLTVNDSDEILIRDVSVSNDLRVITRGDLLSEVKVGVEDDSTSISSAVKSLNFVNLEITEPTPDNITITAAVPLIERVELATATASQTFSSFPANVNHLKLKVLFKHTGVTDDSLELTINGNTDSSQYKGRETVNGTMDATSGDLRVFFSTEAGSTADGFNYAIFEIPFIKDSRRDMSVSGKLIETTSANVVNKKEVDLIHTLNASLLSIRLEFENGSDFAIGTIFELIGE